MIKTNIIFLLFFCNVAARKFKTTYMAAVVSVEERGCALWSGFRDPTLKTKQLLSGVD